jgi:hypothetical protein
MKLPTLVIALLTLLLLTGCDDSGPEPVRSYRMGFQNSAPRFDNFDLFIQSLNIWTPRADAAIMSYEVPWEMLLSGTTPEEYINANFKGLADFYRSKNFELWVYIDPQNGLDRTTDAVELQQAGRSISEPAIQQLYLNFVLAFDAIVQPEHVGLALETNLIRTAAPPAIYNGVKKAAGDAAAQLKARGSKARLSVSVQVDHAWGKLVGGSYEGIAQDFTDFPFVEELGLSSYPYFGFDRPEDIPVNYFSRLVEGKSIPVFVSEGGWTSGSVNAPNRVFTSSPAVQANFISRQHELLMAVNATAVFQLVFTDLDLTGLPPDVPPSIAYFAYLGLVDQQLQPKPALAAWDQLFNLARQ